MSTGHWAVSGFRPAQRKGETLRDVELQQWDYREEDGYGPKSPSPALSKGFADEVYHRQGYQQVTPTAQPRENKDKVGKAEEQVFQ